MRCAAHLAQGTDTVLPCMHSPAHCRSVDWCSRDSIKKLRDDFNEKRREWQNYQKAVRDAKQKEWKDRQVQRQKEYEEQKRLYEEEEAKRDPWEDEKIICEQVSRPTTSGCVHPRSECDERFCALVIGRGVGPALLAVCEIPNLLSLAPSCFCTAPSTCPRSARGRKRRRKLKCPMEPRWSRS